MIYEKTLYILIGIQASGKSTFAKQELSDCAYISLDRLHTRNNEWKALEKAFSRDLYCAIDNTNSTVAERKKYIDFAKENDYKIVGFYFRSSVAECIDRNEKRTGKEHIPIKAILATAKRLEQPSYAEGFDELYYVKIENNKFVVNEWNDSL